MTIDPVTIDRDRTVTVGQLIDWAGQFNEEIRVGVNPEYTRGQVELILDAAALPHEDACRAAVTAAITAASDEFFAPPVMS